MNDKRGGVPGLGSSDFRPGIAGLQGLAKMSLTTQHICQKNYSQSTTK